MKKPVRLIMGGLLLALSILLITCQPQGSRQTATYTGKTTPLKVLSEPYEPYRSSVKGGMMGVNLDSLPDSQQELALKLLNEIPCACGCRKTTVAECRIRVLDCDTGLQQANYIVDQVKAGKSEGQVVRGLYDLILRQRVRGGAGALLSAINPNQSKDYMVSSIANMVASVDPGTLQKTGDELADAREVARLFLGRFAPIVEYLEGVPDEMYILHGITYQLLSETHKAGFEYYFFQSRPELRDKLFPYLNTGTPESDMIIGMAENIFKQPPPQSGIEVEVGKSPTRGPDDAPITIVEYADYQCPFCVRSQKTINQLWDTYPGKVRHVFKHFPLISIHRQAEPAARASMAAEKQGKFWEFRKLIFENQRTLNQAAFEGFAERLGLDVEKFKADMNSPELKVFVQNDIRESLAVGVQSTPTFVINGTLIKGAQSFCAFVEAIE